MKGTKIDERKYRGLIALTLSDSFSQELKIESLKSFINSKEFDLLEKEFGELHRETLLAGMDSFTLMSSLIDSLKENSQELNFLSDDNEPFKKKTHEIFRKIQESISRNS